MKCSYTEVFAIASVNNLGRVDTSYAYWKKNKMNKNLVEENNTVKERSLIKNRRRNNRWNKIATEQRKNMLAWKY